MWGHISHVAFFFLAALVWWTVAGGQWPEGTNVMPERLPQEASGTYQNVDGKEWGYSYPYGDLRPGSPASEKILTYVMDRARESSDIMKSRHPSWRKSDETQTTYIWTDTKESAAQAKDERKPVSIVVPITYAILETLLTYWASSLLGGTIFQYEGVGPEDRYAAILAEKVIGYQSIRFKHALNLYYQIRDSLMYGIGLVATRWHREIVRTMQDTPLGSLERIAAMMGFKAPARQQEVAEVLYEGTELSNIDPYHILPDVNRPFHELQKAEFISWIVRDNIQNILTEERNGYGFNGRAAEAMKPCTSALYAEHQSGRNRKTGFATESTNNLSPVDRLVMVAKIIPKDLGLPGEYPEKWLIEVDGDHILRNLERQNYRHGMFNAGALAPDSSGYDVSPTSRMEVCYPLQHVLDFVINSRVKGLIQAQKIRGIADPLRVNLASLMGDSDVVLLEEGAWGIGIENAFKQITYTDVTAGNIRDAQFIMQILERVSGATDSVQGVMRDKSEAPTAREVSTAHAQSISRLQNQVRIGAIQNMFDLGMQVVSNLQQYMGASQFIDVSGRWEQTLRNEFNIADRHILVDPQVFRPFRDILPRNGAIPSGQNLQGLLAWFQIIASNPITQQRTDIGRLALHVGRELGVQNADDFYIPVVQTQVLPDEEVEALKKAGDIAPTDQVLGEGNVF